MRGLIILAALAALGVATQAGAHQELAEVEEEAQLGGPFILVDQNGGAVTDEDFRGRVLLLTFGYTHCPDVCPTTLMTMSSALHALGSAGRKITPIFVSLDPARDDPARLKEYVESFGPGFVGLGGPEANVASVAARYHVRFAKSGGADYSIDHSAGIYIVGPGGGVLQRLPYDVAASKLTEALRAALSGE